MSGTEYEIKIKNLHDEKPQNLWDIIVDRTTSLGNPFYMYNEYQRDEVCDKYEGWFKDVINNKEKDYPLQRREIDFLYNTLKQHKQLNLFCWCTPKRCHAETIKNYLLYLVNFSWNDLQDELAKLYIISKQQIIIFKNIIEIPELKIIIYEDGSIMYNNVKTSYKRRTYYEIYSMIKNGNIYIKI